MCKIQASCKIIQRSVIQPLEVTGKPLTEQMIKISLRKSFSNLIIAQIQVSESKIAEPDPRLQKI